MTQVREKSDPKNDRRRGRPLSKKKKRPITPQILQSMFRVSRATIRRDLKLMKWSAVTPHVTSNTRGPHWRERRIEFCQREDVRAIPWDKLVFSDEKIFRAEMPVTKEWRYMGKDPHKFQNHAGRHQVPKERWVCGSHVFGLMGVGYLRIFPFPKKGSGKSGGINALDFIKVMRPHVRELKEKLSGKWLVLDGASIHTAKITKAFFAKIGVNILAKWPAHSPDLNPIENLWAIMVMRMDRTISNHWKVSDENRALVTACVHKCARQIPRAFIENLLKSFDTRCTICLERCGGVTGY
jgi:transposase